VVDGSILTLRILVKPDHSTFGLHSRRIATISVDRPSTRASAEPSTKASNRFNRSVSRGKKGVSVNATKKQIHASVASNESDELRRRHKSAKDSSSTSPKKMTRRQKGASQPLEEDTDSRLASDSMDEVFCNDVDVEQGLWCYL
jgi:hypothetical protein